MEKIIPVCIVLAVIGLWMFVIFGVFGYQTLAAYSLGFSFFFSMVGITALVAYDIPS